MLFVVAVASTVDFYGHTDQYLLYTPFHTPDADIGTQTWQTIANTLIFMSVVVVTTCVLVLLFKYQCYKVRHEYFHTEFSINSHNILRCETNIKMIYLNIGHLKYDSIDYKLVK